SAASIAFSDSGCGFFEVERNLRYQYYVGASGDARLKRDPSDVAPHHFDQHNAVVALGSRVQTINRLGRELHRGIEAEGHVSPNQIIVDCFWDSDHWQSHLPEVICRSLRAFAADDD